MYRAIRYFLCAALSAIVCLNAAAQQMRTVKGLAADSSGQPLAGVSVKAAGVQATTDKAGRFTITVPFDTQRLSATLSGYAPLECGITGPYLLLKMSREGSSSAAGVQSPAQPQTLPQSQTQPSQGQPQTQGQVQQQTRPESKTQPKQQKKKVDKSAYAGFWGSVDLSYAYNFNEGTIVYQNIGEHPYGCLHPAQATVSLGYRFSRLAMLYGGAGFLYNLAPLDMKDTPDRATYGSTYPLAWDIPAFIGVRLAFCDGSVHPLLMLQGGIYAMSLTPLASLGFGVSVDFNEKMALNIMLEGQNIPWPQYDAASFKGYPFCAAPSIKIGFSF